MSSPDSRKTPDFRGSSRGIFRQHPMKKDYVGFGQVPLGDILDSPDRQVVVQDHPLVGRLRLTTCPDHVPRPGPGGGGAFQLTRSDRLLEDGVRQEVLSPVTVHDVPDIGALAPGTEFLVDLVKPLPDGRGVDECERPPVAGCERERFLGSRPSHPDP